MGIRAWRGGGRRGKAIPRNEPPVTACGVPRGCGGPRSASLRQSGPRRGRFPFPVRPSALFGRSRGGVNPWPAPGLKPGANQIFTPAVHDLRLQVARPESTGSAPGLYDFVNTPRRGRSLPCLWDDKRKGGPLQLGSRSSATVPRAPALERASSARSRLQLAGGARWWGELGSRRITRTVCTASPKAPATSRAPRPSSLSRSVASRKSIAPRE